MAWLTITIPPYQGKHDWFMRVELRTRQSVNILLILLLSLFLFLESLLFIFSLFSHRISILGPFILNLLSFPLTTSSSNSAIIIDTYYLLIAEVNFELSNPPANPSSHSIGETYKYQGEISWTTSRRFSIWNPFNPCSSTHLFPSGVHHGVLWAHNPTWRATEKAVCSGNWRGRS